MNAWRLGLTCLNGLLATSLWAGEPTAKTCSHPRNWKPTDEQLLQILSDHQRWAEKWRLEGRLSEEWAERNPGGANLCNANLGGAELSNLDLTGADLNNANLSTANLTGTQLSLADLDNANLIHAKMSSAKLSWATLNNAMLVLAELNDADLWAAKLNNADLGGSKLNNAQLSGAELNNAQLDKAELNNATLIDTQVAGAVFAYADLSMATFAPTSQAPSPHVAGIKGLQTVRFPPGREDSLVQLRDLLQKAGLRDLEREATFAIESGKTNHAISNGNPARIAEGIFRLVAFDWTTGYGLHPARALLLILVIWALLIPIYSWAIWQEPRQLKRPSGIYRTWPKERIELREAKPTLDNPAYIERLRARGMAVLGWSAYFSLLSAFQIGFREFSVGTWLTRTQPRNFVLEPVGWVRTLSGFQSLLSVYLLAMWLLTYFGRPFQ
jgi:hypothetical protein